MEKLVRMYAPTGADEGSAKGPNHSGKGHAGEANDEKRNVPNDGPSGENTVNDGERGGGLWTSGGNVTSGTPYNDDYGKPQPDRAATPEPGSDKEE